MNQEEMFNCLFNSLKSRGFGGAAAHRIAIHLTECASESPGGDLIVNRIEVIKDMKHALNQLETEMSLCIGTNPKI